ncbi:acetyl/propionyl/methylcrotonyl-CoA carboxylase subunit alpha [Methylocystis echinoides]|uniref:3-methylcrotonyl-CoA carboxylase subunit alpha n=1 Tax=Methylocystis echinoides TaxID=29468 RepID=A0A9W6GRU2_9HYPH|nr:biotin carboxylase N-terminal domain-containing protein [Methylocystis echinoides]GLI91888.1 3-methylcrotonyl-CoA carboxylase subunit alpha [Methylocystis echinoides]
MFRKVLIANRGEIACRVIRTARKLGVATVAVYSQADQGALHVRRADEAYAIGPATPKESYLSIEKILDVARRSGAEAVHPGYGFLSESAAFAARCAEAGLAFIGPTPEAMRAVGGKAEAKKLMARIGVPTLPAFLGEKQDAESFAQAAASIGFPLVVKASAGGGGRGMRVVLTPDALAAAMASARREALVAFGDDRLLIEKYLERPRHVEVQILSDSFGAEATFPERDCSLQRHHQKLIEESPAPGLSEKLRRDLRQAAERIARAAGYVNAGTVEFLVKDEAFYFLEVNARLQVEHPVTEMVTGVDLVEWQFRIAAGERLPSTPDWTRARGCAIEARICAEDPAEGFRPSSGMLAHLSFPHKTADTRVESGVEAGDVVSAFYDSLLAKLIVWDASRADAVRKLKDRLEAVELVGVATNNAFLIDLVEQEAFISGDADTGLVDRLDKTPVASEIDDEWILAAAVAAWRERVRCKMRDAAQNSPWAVADSWRLYGASTQALSFRLGDRILTCRVGTGDATGFSLETPEGQTPIRVRFEGAQVILGLHGRQQRLTVVAHGNDDVVIHKGRNRRLSWIDPLEPPARADDAETSFVAPLPARVTRIFVRNGDHVVKGSPILVLEAMKMEIPVNAPQNCVIEAVLCREGEAVREGDELVSMAARA